MVDTKTDKASLIVLLIVLVACIIVVSMYAKQQRQLQNMMMNNEHFVDTTATASTTSANTSATPQNQALAQLEQYGISSLEEAKQLVEGTWNEKWVSIPKSGVAILYYSVFSAASRNSLKVSPCTWTNFSPLFEQKLPENCKVDDSKLVFTSKAFLDGSMLGMYLKGVELNNNKGNGPLAMNMGLNVGSNGGLSTSDPQRFSIAFLVRFNGLSGYVGQTVLDSIDLLTMRANTSNNNGIKISLDISNKTMLENYKVNVRVAFGSAAPVALVDNTGAASATTTSSSGVDIKAITGTYYMLAVARNGSLVTISMYGIDSLSTDTPYFVASKSFNYTDVIDFSNMPMQLSPTGFNVTNILSMMVCQEAMSTKDLTDMAAYWKACLVKTGSVAIALSQQTLTLSACPFGDANVCEACAGITDWRNINSLITGTDVCRKAYDNFCLTNKDAAGCECYGDISASNQECTAWKNLVRGTSSCTQTEIDSYIKNNTATLCGASNVLDAQNMATYNPLGRIRDFVAAEDYDTYAVTTASTVKPPTFFQWLFGG